MHLKDGGSRVAWIEKILPENASGKLKNLYARVSGKDGHVDHILQVHSLRPATLEGHMALYKNVLHHSSNRLPKWVLEALGCCVSMINDCSYCVSHHSEGLKKLLNDDIFSQKVLTALETRSWHSVLDSGLAALLDYAEKLTTQPHEMVESDLEPLKNAGYDDGMILEANQVIAYFAYANRTVLGLGVTTAGEPLGLSPSANDSDNWHHQYPTSF